MNDRPPVKPEGGRPRPLLGNAGREHTEKYGTTPEHFAKIGHKNHEHSVNDPYSQFQDEYSLDQIKAAPMVWDPLTKLQCCPTSDGAGAAEVARPPACRAARRVGTAPPQHDSRHHPSPADRRRSRNRWADGAA